MHSIYTTLTEKSLAYAQGFFYIYFIKAALHEKDRELQRSLELKQFSLNTYQIQQEEEKNNQLAQAEVREKMLVQIYRLHKQSIHMNKQIIYILK